MSTASQTTGAEQAWTVGGLLGWTNRFLAQKGVEFPRLDAEVLLAHILECANGHRWGQAAEADGAEGRCPVCGAAALVAWLCSQECSFTTGGVFDLSGGRATY